MGQYVVRPRRACIERDGDSVHVKPKSMAVLVCLANANGAVVTRDEIFKAVWPNVVVSDDALTHCIVELRKAFDDSARDSRFIKTIPKIGFRLVAPVSFMIDGPTAMLSTTSFANHWKSFVAGFAGVAIAALFYFDEPRQVSAPGIANAAMLPSVAVLPFVDLSQDKDHEYFTDGLTEELINRFTQIDGLQVTGRTSSFYFKGRNEDIRSIGEKLGVGHVLEGSIRKSGNRLRITAQLVNVENGFHSWSRSFDSQSADIFAIQDEIAEAVATALKIRLRVGDIGTLDGGTTNVEAFEAVLKGNALALAFDAESLLKMIEHYQQAIGLDPEFALAWERLANVYRNAWLVFGREESAKWSSLADEAIAEALRIAPTSPYILTTAAYMHADRQEWGKALRILNQLTELKSARFVTATMVYADVLTKAGRAEEAVTIKEHSRIIDPLHSGNAMYLAHQYAMLGRTDEALTELERGWALGEYRSQLSVEGVVVSLSARNNGEIRRWLQRAIDFQQPGANGIHQAMLERLDDRDAAVKVLRDAFATSSSTDYYVIVWAAYFGESELALSAMRRSPDLWAIWLPVVADLRTRQEFLEIIASTGLPDYWREFGWGDFCRPIDQADSDAFECS